MFHSKRDKRLLLLEEHNTCLLEEIRAIAEHLAHPRRRVKQVLIAIINKQKFIIMDPLLLKPGTQAPILPALLDAVSGQPIPGATFVPKSNTVDNPALASVDENNNLVYGSAGSGNLTSVNTWTYVDELTGEQVVQDETSVTPFTTLVASEVVEQVVTLGTAVPIPAAAGTVAP